MPIAVTIRPRVVEAESNPRTIRVVFGSVGPRGPAGEDGEPGPGLPPGGTPGQVPVKSSGTDYDTEWSRTITSEDGRFIATVSDSQASVAFIDGDVVTTAIADALGAELYATDGTNEASIRANADGTAEIAASGGATLNGDLTLPGDTGQLHVTSDEFGYTVASDTDVIAGGVSLFRARGTPDAPEVVQDGDYLGYAAYGGGHDGSNPVPSYEVVAFVDGTPSTDIVPTGYKFRSMDDAGAMVDRLIIGSDGSLRDGEDDPLATVPDVAAAVATRAPLFTARAGRGSYSRQSGKWFGPGYGSPATLVHSSGQGTVTPVVLHEDVTIDRIAFTVITGAASSTVTLSLYDVDSNGQPSSKLASWSPVDTSGSGFKAVTLSQALSKGVYWLSAVVLGGGPTLRIIAGAHDLINADDATHQNAYLATGLSSPPDPWTATAASAAGLSYLMRKA